MCFTRLKVLSDFFFSHFEYNATLLSLLKRIVQWSHDVMVFIAKASWQIFRSDAKLIGKTQCKLPASEAFLLV